MQTYQVGSLKLRGEILTGKIKFGIVSTWIKFKIMRHKKMGKRTSVDRKEKQVKDCQQLAQMRRLVTEEENKESSVSWKPSEHSVSRRE